MQTMSQSTACAAYAEREQGSGVYLVVEDRPRDNGDRPRVLETTCGGYPHVTVFYSGSDVPTAALVPLAQRALALAAMEPLELATGRVNSFTPERDGVRGVERHDVLLYLADTDMVAALREAFASALPPTASMREPHVTARVCATRAEADAFLASLTLPIFVTITGVTID